MNIEQKIDRVLTEYNFDRMSFDEAKKELYENSFNKADMIQFAHDYVKHKNQVKHKMKNNKLQKYSLCIFLCAFLFSALYLAISFIENDLLWIVKAEWTNTRFRGVFLIEALFSVCLGMSGIALTDLLLD
jgi:hypothetical protein